MVENVQILVWGVKDSPAGMNIRGGSDVSREILIILGWSGRLHTCCFAR